MKLCVCETCTESGRRPQGSFQSTTTAREHKRSQAIKDRLHRDPPVAPSTRGQPDPATQYADSSHHLRGVASNASRGLDDVLDHVRCRITSFLFPSRLVFAHPPSTTHPTYDTDAGPWEQGPRALAATAPENANILRHVEFLREIKRSLGPSVLDPDPALTQPACFVTLSNVLSSELSRMEAFRENAWNDQLVPLASSSHHPQARSARQAIQYVIEPIINDDVASSPISFTARFLIVALNSMFKLSFKGCRLVSQALRIIVRLAHSEFSRDPHPSALERILMAIPSDPDTARKTLHFEPHSTEFACCSTCFALYPPGEYPPPVSLDTNSDDFLELSHPFPELPHSITDLLPHYTEPLPYPEQCTFKETADSSPCSARLLRFGKVPRPIRTFSYQSFTSWLGRFLCREDIEPHLDASQAAATSPRGEWVDDILFSPEILKFSGPDGLPFLRVHGSEGRYLFSLFVDWFHPRGNRQGGAAYSAGVIFMVCLNLPPTLRYKRENIYLAGVIPGPKAPSLEEVNHLLEPLVFEFRDLWHIGAHFSRTALRRDGRLARCAVVPLICDLGAGRKVSGHASHSATQFCSFCQLPKDQINDLDSASWPRRTCREFRELAEEWRVAADRNKRDALFKKSGVRYSPLLLLPYWQPTRYVVVDTMHNLFLGLFQRHCRRIFGMNVKVVSDNGRDDDDDPDPVSPEELQVARLAAAKCTTAISLKKKFNLRLLRPMYTELGLGSPGSRTKMQLADAIFKRHASLAQGSAVAVLERDPGVDSTRRKKRSVILGKDVIEMVKADMAETLFPSFLKRAPMDVGSASAGTLSAEQWRTFCMINLVITLVRIWGHLPDSDRRSHLLRNFVDLIGAVRAGTAKRVTPEKINAYGVLMLDYLCGLRALFPDMTLVPNHHLALHLSEVLHSFGPTQCYWAFPFERCIRLLRNVNTSFHPSTMERTFFASFCRTTNFLVALRDPAFPTFLRPLAPLLDPRVTGDLATTRPDSTHTAEPVSEVVTVDDDSPLPQNVYNCLLRRLLAEPRLSDYTYYSSINSPVNPGIPILNPDAQHLPSVTHMGRRFCPADRSIGDSNIMFRHTPNLEDRSRLGFGKIQSIFKHKRIIRGGEFRHEVFLAIEIYRPLDPSDVHLDPYGAFEGLSTRLVRTDFGSDSVVVPLHDVVCHVVMCPFRPPESTQQPLYACSVVVALDECWSA